VRERTVAGIHGPAAIEDGPAIGLWAEDVVGEIDGGRVRAKGNAVQVYCTAQIQDG
jgi:hypothetical protein